MDPTSPSRPDDSFHTILASLTVIVGNAQLLERKVARGDAVASEEILATLSSIQRAGYLAVVHLRGGITTNPTERRVHTIEPN